MKLLFAALLAFSLWITAQAGAVAAATVTAEHAWARATPPGATTGVIYLSLVNTGAADERLTGASTPVAGAVQFHSEMNDGGIMRMSPLTGIDVPAGATVVLKPSTTHLMLLRVKHRLAAGDTFPLILTFAGAGPIDVSVRVGGVGAMDEPVAATP